MNSGLYDDDSIRRYEAELAKLCERDQEWTRLYREAQQELAAKDADNATLQAQLAEQDARGLRLAAEVERLREVVTETDNVMTAMLDGEWPIPRLAARLTRLQTIARKAKEVTPIQTDP